jgi:predicted negative regulator of RcsB-dependent stress response
MEDFTNEREQLEAIKRWFNRNGSALVTGIALGLAVLFGWRYWQESTRLAAETASVEFMRMSNALAAEDSTAAREAARDLLGRAPDSAYAVFASMQLARLEAEAGNWEVAASHLLWVIENHPDDPLTALARTRLARVYLQLGRPADALAQVGPEVSLPNTTLTAEVRGDVYRALGKPAEARQYYQQAAELDPAAFSDENSGLALKLDALGGPQTDGNSRLDTTQVVADELARLIQAKAAQPATDSAKASQPAEGTAPANPPAEDTAPATPAGAPQP